MTAAVLKAPLGEQVVSFKKPTLPRMRRLLRDIGSISVLRSLEYERLGELRLSGRVLDYGGGKRVKYSDRISSWAGVEEFEYESVNIDPKTEPTYLIAPGDGIPCEDTRYDAAISLNTFEHVYDVRSVLKEVHRVLRSGAELTFIVPFIFRVHGHPDDYSRGTASFWRRLLDESGFGGTRIEALCWGPFSTGATVSGTPGPFKRLRLSSAILCDLLYSLSRGGASDLVVVARQDESVCSIPLGYFIQTAKQ